MNQKTDTVLDRLEPAALVTVHESFSRQGSTNLEVRCQTVVQAGQAR
jgi:hypothetical protein